MVSRCVNCGHNMSRITKFSLENNQHLRSIVNRWIAPRTVESDDHICKECWNLVNKADALAPLEPKVGHRLVCISCGRSLLRARSYQLTSNTERGAHICQVIQEWALPFQVKKSSLICTPCWMKACRRISLNVSASFSALTEVDVEHLAPCSTLDSKQRGFSQLPQGPTLKSDISLDYYVSQLIQDTFTPKTDDKIEHVNVSALPLENSEPQTAIKTEVDTDNFIEDLKLEVAMENGEDSHLSGVSELKSRDSQLNSGDLQLNVGDSQLIEDTLTPKIDGKMPFKYIELPQMTIMTEVDTDSFIEDLKLENTIENGEDSQLSGVSELNSGDSQLNGGDSQLNTGVSQLNGGDSRLFAENLQLNSGDLQLDSGVSESKEKGLTVPQSIQKRHIYCFNCNRSLQRIRSHTLKKSTSHETKIFDIICEWAMVQEVTTMLKICHTCWQRAYNAAKKQENRNDYREQSEGFITLPNYHRATGSQRKCFVSNCKKRERHRIPMNLRKMLFTKYNYYVSPNNRICMEHLTCSSWNFITRTFANSSKLFNASHIEDFINLLKNDCLVDFNDIRNMEDHLVHYWFGISKREFLDLLAKVPVLKKMREGKGEVALAAYLLKIRTGDSDAKLSVLTKMPRTTLNRLMNKAIEAVPLDLVPIELRRTIAKNPLKLGDDKKKAQAPLSQPMDVISAAPDPCTSFDVYSGSGESTNSEFSSEGLQS